MKISPPEITKIMTLHNSGTRSTLVGGLSQGWGSQIWGFDSNFTLLVELPELSWVWIGAVLVVVVIVVVVVVVVDDGEILRFLLVLLVVVVVIASVLLLLVTLDC
jgi:hypothetical protein